MLNNVFSYISLIFFFIGFVYNEKTLLGISLLIVFILLLGKWWTIKARSNLLVTVESKKRASFKDTPLQITYVVTNTSILPFPNAQLLVGLERSVTVEGIPIYRSEGKYNFYKLYFSVSPRSKISKTVNYQITYRGNYILSDVEVIVSDPFSIYTESIRYLQAKEIAIYPDIFPIKSFKQLFYRPDGKRKSNNHWLEDRIMPKGAREYNPLDPFSKIDWKQSGKTGQLFTKEYEHTVHQEILILANLKTVDEAYMGLDEEKVEQVISTVASLTYYFSNSGTPYRILMNAKLARRNELYRLSASSKKDLRKVLFELAKLKSYTTVDFIHALHQLKEESSYSLPVIIVVSSYMSEKIEKQVASLRRQRYKIVWINPSKIERGENEDEPMEILDSTG